MNHKSLHSRLGFIQGRLSPMVDGKIQAFPWQHWRDEYKAANAINIELMEWTLDQHDLYNNPLMTDAGQNEILTLGKNNNLHVPSLTGDCFMQAPFWKHAGKEKEKLLDDFNAIVRACNALAIKYIVVPLVDNGSLENKAQEDCLCEELERVAVNLSGKIIFESDFPPAKLKTFIARLDAKYFGINYDIGNSAALGYQPEEEITAYADRIDNVHVKDRIYQGTTVPLGTGAADFNTVFSCLKQAEYDGNFILQTARAQDNNHADVLVKYRDFVIALLGKHGFN